MRNVKITASATELHLPRKVSVLRSKTTGFIGHRGCEKLPPAVFGFRNGVIDVVYDTCWKFDGVPRSIDMRNNKKTDLIQAVMNFTLDAHHDPDRIGFMEDVDTDEVDTLEFANWCGINGLHLALIDDVKQVVPWNMWIENKLGISTRAKLACDMRIMVHIKPSTDEIIQLLEENLHLEL